MKKGVLLLQMGGPSSLEGVRPFLYNLFRDKNIIQLPFFMRPFQDIFAKLVSKSRAPKVAKQYEEIGGKSPIKFETWAQSAALKKHLNKGSEDYEVFYAMRYSQPFLKDAFKQIKKSDINDLTVIPLYPQYSVATSGSSIEECKELFEETSFQDEARIEYIESWHDNEAYIKLIVQRIKDTIAQYKEQGIKEEEMHILFSAHGLPEKYVLDGDPYQKQVIESVERVMEGLQGYAHSLAYQSKVGPVKWLEPSTEDKIQELKLEHGCDNLIIVPISFVGDHIETLFELDIEYREVAEEVGIKNYKVTRLPKANKLLVEALAAQVLNN